MGGEDGKSRITVEDEEKRQERNKGRRWMQNRQLKRGETKKLNAVTDGNYTWDYCLVFAVGDEEEIETKRGKKVQQRKFFSRRIAKVLQNLEDAGLETTLYKSVEGDEIYCLIGASERRCKVEAERIKFRLELNADQALRVALNRDPPVRLAVKTDNASKGGENAIAARMCLEENWEDIFVRYDLEIDEAVYKHYDEGPQHPNTIFRTVDRMKLTVSIMEADIEAGGAAFDSGSRNNKGDHNPALACFPLHQTAKRDDLLKRWFPKSPYYNFQQPLEEIRDYFGEKVGLYFAFLGFYTKALYIPALFGIAFFIPSLIVDDGISYPGISVFGLIIAIWATLFLEFWKRKEASLRVIWGQSEFRSLEQPRPSFKGETIDSPVDGTKTEYFPWGTRVKREICSTSVVFTFIVTVLAAVSGIFLLRQYFNEIGAFGGNGSYVVSVINAIQIQIFNFVYGYIAEKLTEWENHETDTDFEDALIAKSFLFKFVNSYNTLYYIAFFKAFNEGCTNPIAGEHIPNCIPTDTNSCLEPDFVFGGDNMSACLPELEIQLAVVFGTIIFMNNSIEYFTPVIMNRITKYQELKDAQAKTPAAGNIQLDYQAMPEDQASTEETALVEKQEPTLPEKQYMRSSYRTFEDYDELIVQFGYVALFITAFPLTPLLALANNFVEIWLDSNKICRSMRRPEPQGASDIGTWKSIINILVFLIVVTNLGLIVFVGNDIARLTAPLDEFPEGALRVGLFFVVEHILLLCKLFIDFVIPDVSMRDKLHVQRQQYIADTLVEGLEEAPEADFYKDMAGDEEEDEERIRRINADKIGIGFNTKQDPHYMEQEDSD